MTLDMTKGSPIKLLLRFTLPVLVGSMLQQGYNLVDGIIVGQFLGVEALAAIGAVTYLDWMLIGFCMAMVQGFAILTAQRFGSGDEGGLRRCVAGSLLLTVAIGLLMTGASLLAVRPLLIALRTPAEIVDTSVRYISVILGCMLVLMLTNLCYVTLRALGDSRTPLYCVILSALANIGLDVLFIVVFQMGVVGAAVGTILAQLACWPFLLVRLSRMPVLRLSRADFVPDGRTVRALLRLGIPMAVQNAVALVGVILLQVAVNGFGVLYMAAFSAAMRVLFFVKEPAVAFSHAISAFVGQNYGAGELARVREGVAKGKRILLIACAVAMLALILFGRTMLSWVLSAEESEGIFQALRMLYVLAAALPALYLMNLYRPALQGMGKPLMPLLSGVVELFVRPAAAFLLPGMLGFLAMGVAEGGAWVAATLLLVPAYWHVCRKQLEAGG